MLSGLAFVVRGYCARSAIKIRTTQIVPARMYRPFHEAPVANRRARIAGPMMDPTPKNPSTVFISDVCSVVDLERSPISARAPVLKTPIPIPDRASRIEKYNERISGCKQVRGNRKQREAHHDSRLTAKCIGKVAQEESGDRDSRHGRVLKRARGCQAQAKRLDDLGNDDSNGIRCHGKHHEHEEGECLDAAHVSSALV